MKTKGSIEAIEWVPNYAVAMKCDSGCQLFRGCFGLTGGNAWEVWSVRPTEKKSVHDTEVDAIYAAQRLARKESAPRY